VYQSPSAPPSLQFPDSYLQSRSGRKPYPNTVSSGLNGRSKAREGTRAGGVLAPTDTSNSTYPFLVRTCSSARPNAKGQLAGILDWVGLGEARRRLVPWYRDTVIPWCRGDAVVWSGPPLSWNIKHKHSHKTFRLPFLVSPTPSVKTSSGRTGTARTRPPSCVP
jgi:hypothetical protein